MEQKVRKKPGIAPVRPDETHITKAPEGDARVFIVDKDPSEMTPREKALAMLRRPTAAGRSLGRQRQLETQMLDKVLARNFKKNAKAYKKVLASVPDLSAIDVIRMTIHMALQENDYETAARWAKELAEYEKPKLQRKELVVKDETKELSDEELYQKAIDEGLIPKIAARGPDELKH